MRRKQLVVMSSAALMLMAGTAQAQTCIGTCGTQGADGVVSTPPNGQATYQYVSTANGIGGVGQIEGVGGANGSEYRTQTFTGTSGDKLDLYFNYVTSDGTGQYSDYAFAELLSGGTRVATLFTARTTPTGDTSPGFGLPANDSTLTPGSTPIIAGTQWNALGSDSGQCFQGQGNGCGNTGWIRSSYTLAAGGLYELRFGVTNFADQQYNSGLAFAGISINDAPIGGGVPEPATWALMIAGFGAVGGAMRRRRSSAGGIARTA